MLRWGQNFLVTIIIFSIFRNHDISGSRYMLYSIHHGHFETQISSVSDTSSALLCDNLSDTWSLYIILMFYRWLEGVEDPCGRCWCN